VTERGYKIALWLSRCQARVLRKSLGELLNPLTCSDPKLHEAITRFDKTIAQYFENANVKTAA
jgi:hypothetical protein